MNVDFLINNVKYSQVIIIIGLKNGENTRGMEPFRHSKDDN